MVERNPGHGLPTQQRGSGIRLAAAYYLVTGLIGTALGAWFVFSLLGEMLGGYCDTSATGEVLCGHALQDLIAPIVASVAGVTLLPSARRLRRDPPRLGLLVGVAVVVGVVLAVLPIILILWAAGFSGEFNIFGSKVPTVGLVLLFSGPLLWALASGVIVWRQAGRQGGRRTLIMAFAAVSLIAVVVAVGGGTSIASRPVITESVGTATLRLARPIELVRTGETVPCAVGAGGEHLSVFLDAGRLPVEGRPLLYLTLAAGDILATGSERRDDGLELWLGVEYPDTGDNVELWSTRESVLEAQREGASGMLRFAKLAPRSFGGDPPSSLDADFEGTIEWRCPVD